MNMNVGQDEETQQSTLRGEVPVSSHYEAVWMGFADAIALRKLPLQTPSFRADASKDDGEPDVGVASEAGTG